MPMPNGRPTSERTIRRQVRQVEADQVMTEQEIGALGKRVQSLQCGEQFALLEMERGVRLVATNSGKAVNQRIV